MGGTVAGTFIGFSAHQSLQIVHKTNLENLQKPKMKLLSLTLLASAALSFAKPVPPTEKFLYNATLISGGPVVIGATPSGDRKIIAITGGSFTGPKLTGGYRDPAAFAF